MYKPLRNSNHIVSDASTCYILAFKPDLWMLAGDFYLSKGLMKKFANLQELAESMQVSLTDLHATFTSHKSYALGQEKDPFGKSE